MTRILSVTRCDDGQFQVTDESGYLVAGPFESNAQAWAALDNLAGEPRVPRKAKTKPPLPARKGRKKRKPTPPATEQEKTERRLAQNAAKAPKWIRKAALRKFDPAGVRAYRDHKLGTFGAASEVRRIEPAVYLAEKAARGE
ncbi:hypothetical protein [Sinorhizobium meliloti]|uniref:hypothetical protein n=1 Tax=Rhizobium meliloti TaxID=382 RepID=UPI000B49A8D7|nr:hypothetical protein [Sinorhizobium meliloti]ASP55469.1 hypothetical protein CDO31_29465 [Sinorhizobium meliloti]